MHHGPLNPPASEDAAMTAFTVLRRSGRGASEQGRSALQAL